MTRSDPTISILIASLGRPSLLATLASLNEAIVPDGHSAEIVIADDSTDGAVARRIAGHGGSLPIRIVPVGARNVAIARNASMDAARGEFLLLVDDDEYVDPAWMVQHLAVAAQFAADAVFGPVYPVYPASTPAWFRAANPLFHDIGWSETGRRIVFGQSGNTLVRASAVRRLGLRFDAAFGVTGGEDDDFFRRMAALGGKLVLTDRAKVWETVPPERAEAGYMLQRMSRTGRIHARAMLRGASVLRHATFAVDAGIKAAVAGLGALVLRPLDRALAFRMRMKFHSNLGKLSALAGARPLAAWKEV